MVGPTVTMFVPYDCNNACPFCVNKKEYRDTSGFDLERCFQALDLMDRIFPHNDVVLTGGEPLAELGSLQSILDHINQVINVLDSVVALASLIEIAVLHYCFLPFLNLSFTTSNISAGTIFEMSPP